MTGHSQCILTCLHTCILAYLHICAYKQLNTPFFPLWLPGGLVSTLLLSTLQVPTCPPFTFLATLPLRRKSLGVGTSKINSLNFVCSSQKLTVQCIYFFGLKFEQHFSVPCQPKFYYTLQANSWFCACVWGGSNRLISILSPHLPNSSTGVW